MSAYSVGRVLALLSLVWSVRHLFLALGMQDLAASRLILVWALAWGVVAVYLWLGRGVVPVSVAVLVMSATDLFLLGLWADYAIMLIVWLALALMTAPHRPRDQLVVAKVLLSTVYAFAALSKLQPSWLMGDNLHKLAASRPQSAWLEPFLVQPWLSVAAAAVVVTELWLAIGLWFRRTRLLTAGVGVLLHLGLTILATHGGMLGLLHLVALNGGLVLIYPAFWQPLMPAGQSERPIRAEGAGRAG
ncbi:MAG: HTTM domain-containing protein [Nocardioides sp.]|nr:HTTM domain-containing protein [Nocardioides sp.]